MGFYKKKWFLGIMAAAAIAVMGTGLLAARQNPSEYSSEEYGISLQYPSGWRSGSDGHTRVEGDDGFFQVSAISGEGRTLNETAEILAAHALQPYGTDPRLSTTSIQGREAALILPSADQGDEWAHEAAMVIKYPEALQFADSIYHYFILTADQDHIEEIGRTVKFTNRQQP